MVNNLKRNSAKELLYMLAILLPALLLIYFISEGGSGRVAPKAKKGFIDLTGWNFERDGNVNLNGEWRFYWKKLNIPAPPSGNDPGREYVSDMMDVPGIWNNKIIAGEKLPAYGYATYMLQVELPDTTQQLAINLLTVSNAYRLYNGTELLASNGTVGEDAEHAKPAYAPKVVYFKPKTRVLYLAMQISNFDHCKGGFWLPIEIGKSDRIQKARDSRVLLEMFLFGCLFIMALYHFSLYFLRRSDASTLFFGLMCAIISIRSLFTGENLINNLFPDISWFLARKIEYILTFCSAPVYMTFSRILYPKQWNRTIYRIIILFGLSLCLFTLVTPTTIYTRTSYVFTGYAWLVGVYAIIVFSRAIRKKQEGAAIFLATSLFFLMTIVNDTLNQLEIIHTGLYLSFGLFIVTFAQSWVLSSRFANSFRSTEIYASTFRKFVPSQFLDRIAKDGIESIKPGNASSADITVLFSDIRSFTSMAEKMTSDEVFQMLNNYLSYVEPPIRANNGFVDKYMGDGIMALFETSEENNGADNAVLASLEMQRSLALFNQRRIAEGKPELKMGIGLHAGQVIIGTLGGNERMDSTAIGDAVNLASRLEGMTKMYGVSILLSEVTKDRIIRKDELLVRFIDKVTAKGKDEPVGIWELIGWRNEPALASYASGMPLYESAIAHYTKREMPQAKNDFEKFLAICPEDHVAKIYLQRCTDYIGKGIDSQHDGVTNLDEK